MRLSHCYGISDRGFIEAVKKFPKLEEIDITMCNLFKDSLEVLGRSCPLLKSLKFVRMWNECKCFDDEAFVIAETMSGLRRLNIKGNELGNVGLIAILDGCPLLESLDVRRCYYLELSESLMKRCLLQVKEFRLKTNPDDEYYDGRVSDIDSLSDHDY
jgi:F-box/leucine-rich repeat protein 2/20